MVVFGRSAKGFDNTQASLRAYHTPADIFERVRRLQCPPSWL